MVVSLAYNIVLICLMNSGMSLIKIKNKRGPKIDPCGTPELIVCGCDTYSLNTGACDNHVVFLITHNRSDQGSLVISPCRTHRLSMTSLT